MNKNINTLILLCAKLICVVVLLISVRVHLSADTVYVLTPFLKVVSDDGVWTTNEVEQLQTKLPRALEARDMASGYSHLGSTLSIDDVLMGIDSLQDSPSPLTKVQHSKISALITSVSSHHREMRAIQRELIEIEMSMQNTVIKLQETK